MSTLDNPLLCLNLDKPLWIVRTHPRPKQTDTARKKELHNCLNHASSLVARNSVGSSPWSPPSDFLMSLSPVKSICVTIPPSQASSSSHSSSTTYASRRPSRHCQAMKLS